MESGNTRPASLQLAIVLCKIDVSVEASFPEETLASASLDSGLDPFPGFQRPARDSTPSLEPVLRGNLPVILGCRGITQEDLDHS